MFVIEGSANGAVVGRPFTVTVDASSMNAGYPVVSSVNWGDGSKDAVSNTIACPAASSRTIPHSSTERSFTHTYTKAGRYFVVATATTMCTSITATGTGRLLATAAPAKAPTPTPAPPRSPTPVTPAGAPGMFVVEGSTSGAVVGRPFTLTVDASSVNAGIPVVSSVDWGDGSRDALSNIVACPNASGRTLRYGSTERSVTHTYTKAGKYFVVATATTVCTSITATGSGRLLAAVAG